MRVGGSRPGMTLYSSEHNSDSASFWISAHSFDRAFVAFYHSLSRVILREENFRLARTWSEVDRAEAFVVAQL